MISSSHSRSVRRIDDSHIRPVSAEPTSTAANRTDIMHTSNQGTAQGAAYNAALFPSVRNYLLANQRNNRYQHKSAMPASSPGVNTTSSSFFTHHLLAWP